MIGLQKYFEVVYAEDAAVANLAALAGGKYLYVPPAAVERVTEGNDVTQFHDFPCLLPYKDVNGITTIQYVASSR